MTEPNAGERPTIFREKSKRGLLIAPDSLTAQMQALEGEEAVRFIDKEQDKFREKMEELGADLSRVTDIHHIYHQYCGRNAGFYPDMDKSLRRNTELEAKRLGLDEIPLYDGWVTFTEKVPSESKS